MNRLRVFLLVLFAVVSATATGRILLVAVGINDYVNQRPLHLCVHDAEVMNWLYKDHQGATTSLILNANATSENIVRTMEELFGSATENDQIVFYFSGHGTRSGLCCYDGVLSFKRVRNIMAESRAGQRMIFADTCFSGKMRKSKSESTSSLSDFDFMLFLASRGNETSREKKGMKNGIFTAYLQRGLRGGADYNKDRTITAKELFTFVSNGVKEMSEDKQHPVMWGKFDDNMVIMKW